jgi:hypothetical protein
MSMSLNKNNVIQINLSQTELLMIRYVKHF